LICRRLLLSKTKRSQAWLVIVLLAYAIPSVADVNSQSFARGVSNSIAPFLAVGELSLFSDGHRGRNAAMQGLKAFAATDLATTVLKATVRERRPDGQSYTSFPSRHTSTAFAMATVIGEYDNSWSAPAYGVAALIGWSRVETRQHYWWDVAAGAALGYFVARAFTESNSAFSGNSIGCRLSW
jgi:membrane-associated phospholipid phosphatase